MAHGTPDWGGAAPQNMTTPTADFGELAARLGSVDTINRQGNVLMIDNFASGLKQIGSYLNGASSYRELSRLYFVNGGWSLHLYADGSAGAYAGLSEWSAVPIAGRVGVEWLVGFDNNLQYEQMQTNGYTVAHSWVGGVRFDFPNHKLQYYNSAGVWTDFAASIYPSIQPYVFHSFKLVIDASTGFYIRFILDASTYDLSAYALFDAGAGGVIQIAGILQHFSLNPNASDAYVGGAILTANEP